MFADVPLAFVDQLIEAVDWKKLAVPAGTVVGFSVLLGIATKLFFWYGKKQIESLEKDLKTERSALTATHQNIESLKIQQAAHAATMTAQLSTIKMNESRLAGKQAEYEKVFAAGQKYYREAVTLREVKKENETLKLVQSTSRATIRTLEAELIAGNDALTKLQNELKLRETQMGQAERRMTKAQKLSGYLIKAKALLKRPKFKPLDERHKPIISVAALKGGVGKTTITAHVAGALARRGYRVLLVDLDLQGSLTGLMLPPGRINERIKAGKLLQDFFLEAMDRKASKLTEYIVAVPQPKDVPGTISIVPTSDKLAYAELNLTLGWLLKQGERDARFLLRRALQSKGTTAEFDVVLLDCPPVLNISCANALAASDYLLIPTLLSTKSLERVPVLVKAIQDSHFLQYLNPHLRLLGIVANRTRSRRLSGRDAIAWQRLPLRLSAVQTTQTKLFTSIIAQDASVSSSEEQYTHPRPGTRAHDMFAQLIAELEKEIPDACRIHQPQPS